MVCGGALRSSNRHRVARGFADCCLSYAQCRRILCGLDILICPDLASLAAGVVISAGPHAVAPFERTRDSSQASKSDRRYLTLLPIFRNGIEYRPVDRQTDSEPGAQSRNSAAAFSSRSSRLRWTISERVGVSVCACISDIPLKLRYADWLALWNIVLQTTKSGVTARKNGFFMRR